MKKGFFYSLLLLTGLFLTFNIIQSREKKFSRESRLKVYEKILGVSLYELDPRGARWHMEAMLLSDPRLRSIKLQHANGDMFAFSESGSPLHWIERVLAGLGLVTKQSLSMPVVVEGEHIGDILFVGFYGVGPIFLVAGAFYALSLVAAFLFFNQQKGENKTEPERKSPTPLPGVEEPDVALAIRQATRQIEEANAALRESSLTAAQGELARRIRRGAEKLAGLALYAAEQSAARTLKPAAPELASTALVASVEPSAPQELRSEIPQDWTPEAVLERLGIDPESLPQYLGVSLVELDRRLRSCREALARQDATNAALHAHTLKSTSLSLHLEASRKAALRLEKAAASGDIPQAVQEMELFRRAFDEERRPVEGFLAHQERLI